MSRLIRLLRPAIAIAAVLLLAGLSSGPARGAATLEGVISTGSSWSGLAVQQWVTDTNKTGLRVDFTDSGSAQGRKDFSAYNNDFAVTDIGYQCQTGTCDTRDAGDKTSRPFAYLPVVGGGTAFPYNITVGGKKVTNLRLSGLTIAKIFTNQITNWNDPAITKDNNGNALPSIPIIPVVHSEGAGTTAMFTRYLATMYSSLWGPFNNGSASMTEYWQRQGAQVAQYGSDGVQNLIAGSSGNGTIGYNEYAYALQGGTPVVKVENAAGYYTLPTQFNDAVALTLAQINMDKSSPDYLLQNLDKVYTNPDPRAYALSSYSYGLIPTSSTDQKMTTGKRQTIANFLFYAVCGGQKNIGAIGYSALPLNLVQASMDQLGQLKTADANVDISQQSPQNCGNPTFDPANPTANRLAEIDPMPPACDEDGAGPCSNDVTNTSANQDPGTIVTTKTTKNTSKTKTTGNTKTTGKTKTTGNSGPGGTSGTTAGNAATAPPGASIPPGATPTARAATGKNSGRTTQQAVDPNTGQAQSAADQAEPPDSAAAASASPAELADGQRQSSALPYGVAAVLLLVLLIVVPPLFVRQLGRRGRS